MAMMDEWGEKLQDIADEGVFSESSLGDSEVGVNKGFPNTMPQKFPYAPTPEKQIHQVGPNRYALYSGGDQVQAAFPGQPIHPAQMQPIAMGQAPIRQATAGMGALGTDPIPGWLEYQQQQAGQVELPAWASSLPTQTWAPGETKEAPSAAASGWDAMNPMQRAGFITGAIDSGIDSIMGVVGGAFQIQERRRQSELEMQQASQMFDAQMRMLNQRISQASGSQAEELRRLLAQAQSAQASGDPDQMMAMLAAMQRANRSVWPWIVGGVAVLGIGGLIIWAVTKKD